MSRKASAVIWVRVVIGETSVIWASAVIGVNGKGLGHGLAVGCGSICASWATVVTWAPILPLFEPGSARENESECENENVTKFGEVSVTLS